LFSVDSLSKTLIDTGRYAEAERLLRTARTRVRETLGTDHRLYTVVTVRLAESLARQGKTHDAQRLRASLKRQQPPARTPGRYAGRVGISRK
jgi:hypothetical protein